MNLLKLSWKYLMAKPFATLLSTVLVALGVSLTSILFLLNQQFQARLYKNIEDIDLVVSAKGSPLQMILSSVYHIDAPTGNIPLDECKIGVLKNPYISKAIPLALGDSYDGFRIVGTDQQFVQHYDAKLQKGRTFKNDLEVSVGARAAEKLDLKIGSSFYGSHGLVQDGGHIHETYAYEVVGIYEQSNLVLDQLILTNVSTVWRMHDSHEDHGEDHGHDHGEDHGHDHGEDHDHKPKVELKPISSEGKDITAFLVQYKKDKSGNTSMRATVEATQIIDEYSESIGYAKPAIQLQHLLEMTGVGMDFLGALALIIILISAFSMFISLYSSLKERRYEMALMRVMGASRIKLFVMIILEGILVATAGFLLGTIVSHIGMEIMASHLEETYKYTFSGMVFLIEEVYLAAGAVFIGFFAAVIPAFQAYKVDISETLSNS
ncbi:ABC transporter permease [Aureispira]|nr:ABC transporter permease [Aureispira sp.]